MGKGATIAQKRAAVPAGAPKKKPRKMSGAGGEDDPVDVDAEVDNEVEEEPDSDDVAEEEESSDDDDDIPDLTDVPPQPEPEPESESESEEEPEEVEPTPEELAQMRLTRALTLKDKGNGLYKGKKYDAAIDFYSEALALEPEDNALVLSLLGNRAACSIMIEKYKQGLADCEKATALDPKFVKGYLRAGKCHIRMGDMKAAREAFGQAKVYEPQNAQVKTELANCKSAESNYEKGTALVAAGKYKQAVACFDIVLNECCGSIPFKLERARVLLKAKRYTEASSGAMSVLRAHSQNADALVVRGEALYYTSTDMEQAMKHFKQALQCDPDNTHAKKMYKQLREIEKIKAEGNEAFKKGKCQQAVELYEQAAAVDPEHSLMVGTLNSNMAAAFMKQRKWAEAREKIDTALELMPENQKALLRRAQCLTELEMYQEAVHDYDALTKLDDNNRDYKQKHRQAVHELKKSKRKNYYKILGVDKSADEGAIKKAYKKAALKCHPDKVTAENREQAEKDFKDVSEAHDILSDQRKRHRYDSGQDMDEGGGGGGFGGQDMDDVVNMFFGGGRGGNSSGFGGGGHGFRM